MKKALLGASAMVVFAVSGILFLSGTEKVESAVIPVDGMSCQGCVEKVRTTLSDLKGVKKVDVSLKEREARVKYDANSVTIATMEQSITKLGYSVGNVGSEAKPSVHEKKHDAGCKPADGCCASKNASVKI
jgi:copper ion binding protein